MSFPKQTSQQKNEGLSYATIQKELADLGVFRNLTGQDYGIDFEIEIVEDGTVQGHSIKVQVKSSDDLNIRKDGHATVGGIKQSTLNYWAEISYSLPVVGMAVDLEGDESIYVSDLLFWQVIQKIDPSGDEEKRDERGHVVSPPTKTIDFGCDCNNRLNMEKLRRFAYGYGLRDFINAHKWLLTNIKDIFWVYSDAKTSDQFLSIPKPNVFKQFLQSAKVVFYYDCGLRVDDESFNKVFDFREYEARGFGCGPTNIDVYNNMERILKTWLLPLLNKYRDLVLGACYYWLRKDRDYIRLVFQTNYPDVNDDQAMLRFGYEEEEDEWGNTDWEDFIWEQQKRYGINDNSLVLLALR